MKFAVNEVEPHHEVKNNRFGFPGLSANNRNAPSSRSEAKPFDIPIPRSLWI
jgi:hypothetical protein